LEGEKRGVKPTRTLPAQDDKKGTGKARRNGKRECIAANGKGHGKTLLRNKRPQSLQKGRPLENSVGKKEI